MTHDEIETFCKEQTQRLRDKGYPQAWVWLEFNGYGSGDWRGCIYRDKYGSKYDPTRLYWTHGISGAVSLVKRHISTVQSSDDDERRRIIHDLAELKDRAEKAGIEIIAEIKG